MRLLALDTATELCSAALWLQGQILTREDALPRAGSDRLLEMIDSLLSQAGMSLRQLDAVAFGRGPGAFTGVRIATAVAQGLGFAADLPLLPVSDLRAIAQGALAEPALPERVLVCQDARLRQVYWSCLRAGPGRLAPAGAFEAVGDPAAVRLPPEWQGWPVCGAGSGFGAYPALQSHPEWGLVAVRADLRPRAAEIARLASSDGLAAAVPPEEALPVYLRDEVAIPQSSE